MYFSTIIRLFNNHSCSVIGAKGSGKDVLTGNVIARRKKPYCSNCNYGYDYYPFDYNKVVPDVSFCDIVSNNVKPYKYPFPDGTDIYLSDCGILFPSQYCNELNKMYPSLSTFMAISRHLGDCRVHTNTQHLSRTYDKIREQSDIYILCEWLIKPLIKFGIVVQSVIIYDKYESALNKVRPCRVRSRPLNSCEANATTDVYIDNFYNQHGRVKRGLLIYFNKSKHNSRFFRDLFSGEVNK